MQKLVYLGVVAVVGILTFIAMTPKSSAPTGIGPDRLSKFTKPAAKAVEKTPAAAPPAPKGPPPPPPPPPPPAPVPQIYPAGDSRFTRFYTIKLPATLEQVRMYNNKTRQSVAKWVDKKDWSVPPSMFNYGMPERLLPLINLPVGDEPIQHDVLSFLTTKLNKRIVYLEIGVAVGKCLYTQLQFLGPDSLVVAYDLEDINPTFARLLQPQGIPLKFTEEVMLVTKQVGFHTTRRASKNLQKHGVDSIRTYKAPSGCPLAYMACDEFNILGWEKLAARIPKYNVVLSDAQHTEWAILAEWWMIKKHKLIDYEGGFIMVWDDCVNTERSKMADKGFKVILKEMREENPKIKFCGGIFAIRGWVGASEYHHDTCIASTLNLDQIRKADPTFANIKELYLDCDMK